MNKTIFAAGVASVLTANGAYAIDSDGTGPFRLGAGIEGGRVSVIPEKPAEADKSGPAFGVKAFAEVNSRWITWTLGVSKQSARLSGKDNAQGVDQGMTVNSVTGQSGLFLNFTRKLSLGVAGRIHQGPSADYEWQTEQEQKTFRDAGPALRVTLPILARYNLAAEAAWLRSLSTDDRKVDTVLASLSASIPVKMPSFGKTTMAAKILNESRPVDRDGPTGPEVSSLYFLYASNELEPKSLKRVAAIVSNLKGRNLSGLSIEVIGYGSRTGSPRRTLDISLQRAETIAAMLVSEGIPANALEVSAYGSSVLDPSETPHGDRQRRVLLKLKTSGQQTADFATYALSMGSKRVPPSVVYKAEELWGLLEAIRVMRKSDDKSLAVAVDLPASVARQAGTWEKVREGIDSILNAGLAKEGLVTRVSQRRGDILFKIKTSDKHLLARLDGIQAKQKKLVALSASRLEGDDLASKLIESSELWSSIEVPSRELRRRLIDAGIAPARIRAGQDSDLWSYTSESIRQSSPDRGVIIVHASRSKKRLDTTLNPANQGTILKVMTPGPHTADAPTKEDPAKNAILQLMAKPLVEKQKPENPDSKGTPGRSHRRDPWRSVPLGGGVPADKP